MLNNSLQNTLKSSTNPVPEKEQGFSAEVELRKTDEVDELASFLSLVERDNSYIVDEVLKKSDFEETQKVFRLDASGKKTGPYIRKYLHYEVGIGLTYQTIFEVQRSGVHFDYLPHIYDCFLSNDTLIVIMEFIQGETLQDVVYRCDPSVQLAADVFPRLCEAVRELHEKFPSPIIHRDLKPTNIIMSFNRLTIIDFGIARSYKEDSERDTVRFGTKDFAPPEQFGYGQTDTRSDVYALGLLLYYCLTEKIADAQTRSERFFNADIPRVFKNIVSKACSFDPDDRYSCVKELENDFSLALQAYYSENEVERSKELSRRGAFSKEGMDPRGKLKAKRVSGVRALQAFFQNIPAVFGKAWNCVLLALWIFMMVIAINSAFVPNEANKDLPLWFLLYEYVVFFGALWSSWTYALLDKRRLFQKFRALRKFTLPMRLLIFGLAVPLFLTICLAFVAQFVVPNGVFVS